MDLAQKISQYLTELYLPGAVAIWCSLLFGMAALWGYASAMAGDPRGLAFGRRAYRFYAAALTLACAVLATLLLMRDFRIEYIHSYSGLDLATHFQFAAFWAGQKGSFLLWLLWGTLLGVLLLKTVGKKEATVMSIYTLTLFGLLLILVRENPFVMLAETPVDGKGLNPLLQDEWMVIHPPIMFIGYSLTAIPFAFAIAAMWRRDYKDWAVRAFPWALGAFGVLGLAILLGGYWAYETLGWGGYWGWDPVENASLIPFILSTALIHGLHMERTKGRFRRMNLILACLGYLSVLYGTFLTRSGVLADFSVHSFVDLGISGLLIIQMAFFVGISVWLLATRLGAVKTAPNEDEPISRGFFMILGSITLLVSAILVTLGTSAPLLTKVMENPAQVGPAWYNTVHMPLALVMAGLLAMVPALTWKGMAWEQSKKKFAVAAVIALVLTVGCILWPGVSNPFHVVIVFLAAMAIITNAQKTVARYRVGGLAGSGGYLAHVGVGLMLIGFLASSAYDHSTKVVLEQGVPHQVADRTFTFERFIPRQGDEKEAMEVKVEEPGRKPIYIYPRLFLNNRTRQLMANPDIRKTMAMDLYVSPIEYRPAQEARDGAMIELAKDQGATLDDGTKVRFLGFELDAESGNALAQMENGGMVAVGASVELQRNGETLQVLPIYRLDPASRRIETPPLAVPGGGVIRLTGIDPSQGAVRLDFRGIGGIAESRPASLAVDITSKPLINLVWFGLIVVLMGGGLATSHRLWHIRVHEQVSGG